MTTETIDEKVTRLEAEIQNLEDEDKNRKVQDAADAQLLDATKEDYKTKNDEATGSEVFVHRQDKEKLLNSLIPSEDNRKLLVFGEDNTGLSDTGEYPFTVDRQVSNVSDKTSLTFGLNSTKKIVLGDNTSFTLLNGINLDVSLSIQDDTDKKGNLEKPRISFSGIAKSVVVGAETLSETLLDEVHPNKVVLPVLKDLRLSYGNINTVASQRLLGVEFMPPEDAQKKINLFQCDYASFRLITKERITAKDLQTVPLVDGLASGDPDLDGYLTNKDRDYIFEGCNEVNLTEELKADVGIKQVGVGINIVQYQRGLGRIAYEEMTGMSKSVTYATDQYSNVYCKGAKFTVICAPWSTEAIYTVNTTNNYVRGLNSSLMLYGIDVGTTIQGIKITPNVIGLDMSASTGVKMEIHNGAEIKTREELAFENDVLKITRALLNLSESDIFLSDNLWVRNLNQVQMTDSQIAFNETRLALNNFDIGMRLCNMDVIC